MIGNNRAPRDPDHWPSSAMAHCEKHQSTGGKTGRISVPACPWLPGNRLLIVLWCVKMHKHLCVQFLQYRAYQKTIKMIYFWRVIQETNLCSAILSTYADNVSLSAFARRCCSSRSISPAGQATAADFAAVAQAGTDKTDARQMHKRCSAYCADSANNRVHFCTGCTSVHPLPIKSQR